MKNEELKKIVDDDDLGLLKVKEPGAGYMQADARLILSFKEIEDFVRATGREPRPDPSDMREFKLNSRLAGLRASRSKMEALTPIDELRLLRPPVETVAGAVADDDMGLLDAASGEDIFSLRHVPSSIAKPDTIARREPCADFDVFEPLFKQCQAELASGLREARPFTGEQQIEPGHFFVVRGVMVYVAEAAAKELRNKKTDARLRVIYENGTESNLLLRSLARELYKDAAGRRILDSRDEALDDMRAVTGDDEHRGFVYVLRSRSERAEIRSIDNLYKIGFSTVPVEERIANAVREPTYLMAPVSIVAVYQCFNLNPQKFEVLLHAFFGRACLEMQVYDAGGRSHAPREWFIAPLDAIDMAVRMLVNGEIVHYRYDSDLREVVER